MKKLNNIVIVAIIGVISAVGCNSHNEQKKVSKTYNVSSSEECIVKGGYWYKGKCWANFDDEGIPADKIDSVVNAEMKQIQDSKISINEHKYPIKMILLEEDGNKEIVIVAFTKKHSLESLVIEVNNKSIKKGKKNSFIAKAAMFNKDIIQDIEAEQYSPVAFGEVTAYVKDNENMVIHFEGKLKDKNNQEFNVEFLTNEVLSGAGLSTVEIKGNEAFLNGGLGTVTYTQIKQMIERHPEVKTLVFGFIKGSVNDAINMHTGRLIRNAGLTTKVLANSRIASGGVDLFCAGEKRIVTEGAKLGVHSWKDGEMEARSLPIDHPAHQYQVEYFNMCLGDVGEDFYFYTLATAPADDIHWMSIDELKKWHVATEIIGNSDVPPRRTPS